MAAAKKSNNKMGIFADVQNIYYTTRQAFERHFDYRKLWREVAMRGDIVIATAYATDRNDDKQKQFQNALREIGFSVRLKPYIRRQDGSAKADWDVGITIDILDAAADIDTAVLLSGDGDFDLLMNKLRTDCNVTTEVYGVPSLTARSLIESVDHFHPIDESLLL
jgi:uncharacterized LabA/DUF88 family protein